MLSPADARRTYDRIGRLQDTQAFYEDRATGLLLRHGGFESARAVFEFGCGTGRFAHRLLAERLAPDATYRGMDVSPTMVGLARRRLARFAPRAEVVLSDGGPPAEPARSYDRVVSTYVFDLLSGDDIRSVLAAARRMLRPEGLVCLAGLSTGVGPASRVVSSSWRWIQARYPSLVGGCRPLDLLPFLPESDWDIRFHQKVVAWAVASEAVVARPR
jgi:cyclopropane fatty-acyl-phospholipid synthase-like methyltransferase